MVGNLDEDGYLAASEEELAAAFSAVPEDAAAAGTADLPDAGRGRSI